jgi:hypothetical protein
MLAWNPPVQWIKEQLEKTGTKIGNVHFIKRTDGKLRKMNYRLHVTNPSIAKAPSGTTKDNETLVCKLCGNPEDKCPLGPYVMKVSKKSNVINKPNRKVIDNANNQITVFDVNGTVRDNSGNIIGRGKWRTIPLESVIRISRNKEIVEIIRT